MIIFKRFKKNTKNELLHVVLMQTVGQSKKLRNLSHHQIFFIRQAYDKYTMLLILLGMTIISM